MFLQKCNAIGKIILDSVLVEEISRMIRAFGLPAILSTGDRHRQCDHAKLDNVAILVCTSSENLSTTNTK